LSSTIKNELQFFCSFKLSLKSRRDRSVLLNRFTSIYISKSKGMQNDWKLILKWLLSLKINFSKFDATAFTHSVLTISFINFCFRYTPDFTTSQVSHTLRIWTSQANVLTFNLNVSLPHHLLPACQSSIPRPYWEQPLYFGFVTLTLLGFVGIMLISYLEVGAVLNLFLYLNVDQNLIADQRILEKNICKMVRKTELKSRSISF